MANEEDGSSTLLSKKSAYNSVYKHNMTHSAKSPLVELIQQIMSQRGQVVTNAGLSMII